MATQAALRGAEWDVVELNWEHGPSPVNCVFRRVRGDSWEPWVIVARSAIHSASCPLTFYEKKSSLSGKWRRPGVWPGAPKREIRDLGVI